MSLSVIDYYGKQLSRCGYCKGQKCSTAHSMHAFELTTQDYQDLIDRGWRRSGHYCYKPEMSTTCCPCYTIKCDALEFKLSKSHKKILKRFNRYLRDGKKDADEMEMEGAGNAAGEPNNIDNIMTEPQLPANVVPELNLAAVHSANEARIYYDAEERSARKSNAATHSRQACAKPAAVKNDSPAKESLKMPSKKAKQIRMERRQAKLTAKGICTKTAAAEKAPKHKEKTLKDFLNETSPKDKHKLKIVLVHSSKLMITDEAFNLYRKYQLSIHNDKPERLTKTSLERFLYKTPLKQQKTSNGPASGYGSFHQQYWLDDQLIAVGVIDILPYCISSVYFFYDPDYSFLTLGTYGSLREIAFVQELAEKIPALRYYYMGFYVHSCPKMRYKGRLVPSYLLCPETYTWHLLTPDILAQLDAHKYQRLNPAHDAKDEDEFCDAHLDGVLLLIERNRIIRYREYIQITGDADDRECVLEYGKMVGRACSQRMIYLKLE